MDEELFKKGLEKRKATLGAEYVEKNLENADDFTPVSYTHLTLPTKA